MNSFLASIRIAGATMGICVVGYAAAVWAVAQAITPETANGSLITLEDGTVIGSRQVAQAFTEPGYFWPRPSAVDYDGGGAGGSNWSPTSDDVAQRGREIAAMFGATSANLLPADLATASGSGLDPHISEAGALYQVARIAEARALDPAEIEAIVRGAAYAPGGVMTSDRVVNVLELNLALDGL